MYARIGDSDAAHTACSARPRPFSSNRATATLGSVSASAAAIAGVASVLALSAIVIR